MKENWEEFKEGFFEEMPFVRYGRVQWKALGRYVCIISIIVSALVISLGGMVGIAWCFAQLLS